MKHVVPYTPSHHTHCQMWHSVQKHMADVTKDIVRPGLW